MSGWTVNHNGLVRGFATAILLEANLKSPPDSFVVRHEVFGIVLTYERSVLETSGYRYTIFTDRWTLEMKYDPATDKLRLDDFEWIGHGDYDRWLRDASLLKLAGI